MAGYPWSHGDTLLASDLNAAFANVTSVGMLPLTGGTLTGPLTGTSVVLSGALQASGATFFTTGGIGTVTVGAGSSNHIVLGSAATGSTPSITGTGDSGLLIATQNSQAVKFIGPVSMSTGPITLTSNSIFMNNGGAGQILSGSTYTKFINANFNVSGTYSGTTPTLYSFSNSSDTADTAGASHLGGLTQFSVAHAFGGTNTTGGRTAFQCSLWAAHPITGDAGPQQYVAGTHFGHGSANVGGVDLVGGCKGYMYGGNFVSNLEPGATNWTLLNGLGEVNTACQGMMQTLTVSGTVTAGDVLNVTFTSTAIAGSPLTLSHTVAAGETVNRIASTFQSLVLNNAALQAALVSSNSNFGANRQPIQFTWQTGTTLTISTSTSGGATEVLTLGTAPASGGSVRQKFGVSFIRGVTDSYTGTGTSGSETADTCIYIASQGNGPVGAWDDVIGIKSDAIKAASSILRLSNLTGLSSGGRNGVLPTPSLTWGIHLGVANFADQNGYAFLSPGFSVGGTGTVSVGNVALAYAAGGASLDVKGYAGSGNASVVSGGGGGAGVDLNNYYLNDLIYDDLGGQHVVTSVNSDTGAVTGLRTIVQPFSTGSLPTATRATTGGSGLSLTIGITWVASSTLALNPSGGQTNISGPLLYQRVSPASNNFSDFDIRRTTTFTGGTTANINAALRVTGTYGVNDATQNWNLASVATTSGVGGILVAGDFQSNRAVGSTNAIWGSISEARDLTDLSSTSGAAVLGMEVDIRANKLDDAANASTFGGFGVRKAIQIVTSRMSSADATLTEFSNGIWFGQSLTSGASDTLSYMDSAIGFATNSQIIQGLDTRGTSAPSSFAGPVAAVRMSAGQIIDFNGGAALNSAAGNYFAYNTGGTKLQYMVSGTEKFSVADTGNSTVAGTLTVNGTGTGLTVAHAMSVTGLATLSGGFTGNGVGGVLSGANAFLQVGNGGVRTYSGAASGAQASIMSEQILRGTVASGLQAVNYLWVPDDGAVGPTSNGQIATLQILHTCSANAVGNRWGVDIALANSAITAAGVVSLGGIRAQSLPAFNMGGTGVALGTSQGVSFGANISAFAQGTATNLRTVTGMEIDVGITAGASAYSKEGLKIVLLSNDAVQGAVIDYGFSIQSQVAQASGVGFKTGIVFGGNGGFGVAATGTLMGAFVGVGGMTAALGIDFSGVTFSETPIKVPVLTNAANDAAAAAAGISVGGFYRNGSVVMQRVA